MSRDAHRRRVCIIGPGYLSDTPRIVKEADALAEAGLDVRVVFSQGGREDKREHDEQLLRGREWSWTAVRWSAMGTQFLRWGMSGCRQRLFQRAPRASWGIGLVAERGEGRVFPELARAAAREAADLYIGHYADCLAAAAVAAKRWGTRLGFDAEDFHTGESNSIEQIDRVDFIQRRYLPLCDHVTAASSGIASALAARYHIGEPLAVHNAFSWSERSALDRLTKDRRGNELSLYWYSQTVGLDRGIQDAINAVGQMAGPVQLHVRGAVSRNVADQLLEMARENGIGGHFHLHERVAPTELISRAVEHDVGLALERADTENRAICATNKMFFYLLAGLAVAASDVPGQRMVLKELPDASFLYTPGDVTSLAQHLEKFRTDREALERAKAAALRAAERHWNWENESRKLVDQVLHVLEQRPRFATNLTRAV